MRTQRRLKGKCQKLIGLEPPTTRKVRMEEKILVTFSFTRQTFPMTEVTLRGKPSD